MAVISISVYGAGLFYDPYGTVNPSVKLETNKTYVIATPPNENLLPSNPSVKYEIEVEANSTNILVTTKQTQQTGKATLYRTKFNGSFSYDASGNLVLGTVLSVERQLALNGADINQSQRNSIKRISLNSPLDWNTLNNNGGLRFNIDYTETVDTGKFSDTCFAGVQLKDGWQFNPFAPAVLGGSSSGGNGPTTSPNTWNTSTNVDQFTGVAKQRDIFVFSADPGFGAQADSITNFSAKDKDVLQFSKSAFGISVGKFAIANNSKNLNKLLASDTNFIYNQKSGELIFNANGLEAGFGTDGGVFAQLVGAPKLTGGSVSFT